jgi:L-iditol 2-dehydrogenase
MKALMKTKAGVGNLEIRDLPEPVPGPGQVLIEVKAAGICGTDIHIYHDTFRSNPPVILGHEFCGVVKGVGPGVTEFKPGDRVTSETAARVCGKCRFCRTGHYNLCPERLGLGYGVDGVFTKYCVVRKKIVHSLPDSVDFRSGAMCEPLSCAVHGVIEQTGVRAGDVVAVIGPGAIGLLAAQVAMAEGGTVVVLGIDADKDKFAVAEALGCKRTINISKEDPLKIIRDLSDGYGADVVLECSGAAPAARLGFQLASKRGRYCQMGLFGKPIEIDLEQIAYKELDVSGFISQKWTAWQTALRLLQEKKVNLGPLISQELALADWREGFESKEKGTVLKTLLYPE